MPYKNRANRARAAATTRPSRLPAPRCARSDFATKSPLKGSALPLRVARLARAASKSLRVASVGSSARFSRRPTFCRRERSRRRSRSAAFDCNGQRARIDPSARRLSTHRGRSRAVLRLVALLGLHERACIRRAPRRLGSLRGPVELALGGGQCDCQHSRQAIARRLLILREADRSLSSSRSSRPPAPPTSSAPTTLRTWIRERRWCVDVLWVRSRRQAGEQLRQRAVARLRRVELHEALHLRVGDLRLFRARQQRDRGTDLVDLRTHAALLPVGGDFVGARRFIEGQGRAPARLFGARDAFLQPEGGDLEARVSRCGSLVRQVSGR